MSDTHALAAFFSSRPCVPACIGNHVLKRTLQEFDAQAVDSWSLGTTLFMALLGVQPWEEVGDYKFQAIAEGKNLDVVLEGWKLRDVISQDAVDLLQVRAR